MWESKEKREERIRKEVAIAEMLTIRSSSIGELINYVRRLSMFKRKAESQLTPPELEDDDNGYS